MSSPLGSFDPLASLAERGVDLAALGAAYLVLLATAAVTIAAFFAARHLLVISPNRGSRDCSASNSESRTLALNLTRGATRSVELRPRAS